MSSVSKKGTQIYYPIRSEVPASQSPPCSPSVPVRREMPESRAFLNVSFRFPSKWAIHKGLPHSASSERNAPLLEPLHSSLKVFGRWASIQVPQQDTYGMTCPSPEPFLPLLQVIQQGALLPIPLYRAPIETDVPHPEPLPTMFQNPLKWAHTRLGKWDTMKGDAHFHCIPLIRFPASSPLQSPLTELPQSEVLPS